MARGRGVWRRPWSDDPLVKQLIAASEEAGMGPDGLAKRLGLGYEAIQAYRRGERVPPLGNLHRWAALVGKELALVRKPRNPVTNQHGLIRIDKIDTGNVSNVHLGCWCGVRVRIVAPTDHIDQMSEDAAENHRLVAEREQEEQG